MWRATIITLSLAALAACSSGSAFGATEKYMCADYVIAVDDWQSGLLTDTEFRSKLRDVTDDAQLTDSEQLARNAMAAVTSGTPDEIWQALKSFADHCSAVIR